MTNKTDPVDPKAKTEEISGQREAEQPVERIHTELPTRPHPNKKGYEFPDYESWTDEELHAVAENLGIPGHETLERDALIDALSAREHR